MSTVCAEMEIGSAITKMIAKNRDVILILKFFFITLSPNEILWYSMYDSCGEMDCALESLLS